MPNPLVSAVIAPEDWTACPSVSDGLEAEVVALWAAATEWLLDRMVHSSLLLLKAVEPFDFGDDQRASLDEVAPAICGLPPIFRPWEKLLSAILKAVKACYRICGRSGSESAIVVPVVVLCCPAFIVFLAKALDFDFIDDAVHLVGHSSLHNFDEFEASAFEAVYRVFLGIAYVVQSLFNEAECCFNRRFALVTLCVDCLGNVLPHLGRIGHHVVDVNCLGCVHDVCWYLAHGACSDLRRNSCSYSLSTARRSVALSTNPALRPQMTHSPQQPVSSEAGA
jgi:hypothetical protein